MAASEADLTEQEQRAQTALREASEGDKVLWNDRQEPATVVDVGGTGEQGDRRYLVLKKPRGEGNYVLRGYYTPTGHPDFRTESGEQANDLRIVEQDEPDSEDSADSEEGEDEEEVTTLPDGRRLGEDVGQRWPQPSEDAEVSTGDDFIVELTEDPLFDFEDFLDAHGYAEGDLPDNPLSRFLKGDEDTWMFVDELLAFGEDVPKTVNNWHLIDYGVITDDASDNTRKAAWYNVESDELAVVAAVQTGDDGGPRWFVYHAENGSDPTEEDRQPILETDDPDAALNRLRDLLYGDAEEVDLSIEEEPRTGELTVSDAISNTRLAEAVMSAKDADPFGLRSYARNASAADVVMDVDAAIFDTLAAARSRAGELRDRFFSWWSDNKQAIGKGVKYLIVQAIAGISRRFVGVRIKPVIRYNKLGIVADYKYNGELSDDDGVRAEFDGELAINPQKFDLHKKGPFTSLGIDYVRLVQLAEWANVDKWVFDIPNPYNEQRTNVSVGTTSTSRPRSTEGKAKDAVTDALKDKAAPNLLKPGEMSTERVEELFDELPSARYKNYLVYYAMVSEAVLELDEDLDERYDDTEKMKSYIGSTVFGKYRKVAKKAGLEAGEMLVSIPTRAVVEYQSGGAPTVAAALNTVLDEMNIPPKAVARSDDFDEYAFKTGGTEEPQKKPEETPEETSDESEETSEEPQEGGAEKEESEGGERKGTEVVEAEVPDDGEVMDEEESESTESESRDTSAEMEAAEPQGNARVNTLVNKLESGVVDPSDLTSDEKELLRDAAVEVEEVNFTEDERRKLNELERQLDDSSPVDESSEPIETERPTGNESLDRIAGMTDEEKAGEMGHMYGGDDFTDYDYESRDDEFDRLP